MAKKTVTTILDQAVMTDNGLTLNGVVLEPVIDKCEGCDRAVAHETGSKYCTSYAKPATKWTRGMCNFATHIRAEKGGAAAKVNPLKASKRAARGR